MPLIEWSDELALGEAQMDATHREFVDCLNAMDAAEDADFVAALDAFIAHSDAHFSDENARMEATTFPPSHCHVTEHANVLGLCREVRQMVLDGKLEVGRVLARELAPWFRNHAATMDRMLAYWLTLDEAGRLEALRQGAEATRAAQAAGQVANCSAGTACSEHGHPQSDTVGA